MTGACIYMPEHPQGWTYSITFRLVGTAAERGFKTCQLDTRMWEIQDDGGQRPEHVQGEGVVGFFPILTDGGWIKNQESDPHSQYPGPDGIVEGVFRYQSCAGRRPSMSGQFGGKLVFVPGTRGKPEGAAFQARLMPFRLSIPEYIY